MLDAVERLREVDRRDVQGYLALPTALFQHPVHHQVIYRLM